MEFIPEINITDFTYPLPPDKIAQYPIPRRDESKLLILKGGVISEDIFKNIYTYLPDHALLIRNETKVVQARLIFKKETGAAIEIFCLEPVQPTREIQQAFTQNSGVAWNCLVGNSKRWKSGKLTKRFTVNGLDCFLTAERITQDSDHSLIRFEWNPAGMIFSDVLLHSGIIPLPSYVKREAEENDKVRYQTIYARDEGSVAAPTAGLHFTEEVFQSLKQKKIDIEEVTLHVGAGTFKPVNTPEIRDHEMHTEKILVQKKTISKILKNRNSPLIAVGTTTIRTIESLYWFGVKLIVDKPDNDFMDIHQWDAYNPKYNIGISPGESLQKVMDHMDSKNLDKISGQTQLIIVPGYTYRLTDILITNFHMPKSTLLLLVSAFAGDDWKNAYAYALNHNFRFLSYGDSCLFYKSS